MTDRTNPLDELARKLTRRPHVPPRLTGSTIDAGNSEQLQAEAFTNPMTAAGDVITAVTGGAATRRAIGTEAQVLTVEGGLAVWRDPAVQAGAGRYRHLVLAEDGVGGWGFVVATIDSQTWPVTATAALEA